MRDARERASPRLRARDAASERRLRAPRPGAPAALTGIARSAGPRAIPRALPRGPRGPKGMRPREREGPARDPASVRAIPLCTAQRTRPIELGGTSRRPRAALPAPAVSPPVPSAPHRTPPNAIGHSWDRAACARRPVGVDELPSAAPEIVPRALRASWASLSDAADPWPDRAGRPGCGVQPCRVSSAARGVPSPSATGRLRGRVSTPRRVRGPASLASSNERADISE